MKLVWEILFLGNEEKLVFLAPQVMPVIGSCDWTANFRNTNWKQFSVKLRDRAYIGKCQLTVEMLNVCYKILIFSQENQSLVSRDA